MTNKRFCVIIIIEIKERGNENENFFTLCLQLNNRRDSCETGNHLKRCVRIVMKNDKACGVCGEWIFCHKGVNAIMAKVNRIARQRKGR